jgi:hypothetical protein
VRRPGRASAKRLQAGLRTRVKFCCLETAEAPAMLSTSLRNLWGSTSASAELFRFWLSRRMGALFARQVEAFGTPASVAMGISTGNSLNVLGGI